MSESLKTEITYDDFNSLKDIAKLEGWYKKKFFCPNCDLLIKIETWDKYDMFSTSTILKDNAMPNYCPNCGKIINYF